MEGGLRPTAGTCSAEGSEKWAASTERFLSSHAAKHTVRSLRCLTMKALARPWTCALLSDTWPWATSTADSTRSGNAGTDGSGCRIGTESWSSASSLATLVCGGGDDAVQHVRLALSTGSVDADVVVVDVQVEGVGVGRVVALELGFNLA